MKKIYIALLLSGCLMTGCKKLINQPDDTVITTDVIFNTSRDLDNLLYGAYGALANGNTLAGNWKIFPELLADNVVINAVEVLPTDPYTDLYNRNMTVAQYPENWRLAYVAIQNANTVLYAVKNGLITREKDAEFNDATKNRIIGEAYFLRAVSHFELVRLYGQPYGSNSTASNSGVILKTVPTLNASGKDDIAGLPRATVEQVYQQVISDLQLAENLMPATPVRRGRATSYAAAAYLARVYFQQNDYANALTEIGKVIGTTPGAVTSQFGLVRTPAIGAVTAATASSNVLAAFNSGGIGLQVTENIFDLVSVTGNLVNPVITRKYFQSGTIQPHLGVSATLLANAAFAANDARRVNLMSTVGGKTYSKKFDNATMNIPVIRSAELLLDRAEINAMNAGTSAQALSDATKDLNLIRDRAIPGYNSATVVPAAAILAEVRRERIRELAFEGDRLHDLRRQQAVVGPGDRTVTTVYQWNSNALLFKIPDAEILANPNIVQNPN